MPGQSTGAAKLCTAIASHLEWVSECRHAWPHKLSNLPSVLAQQPVLLALLTAACLCNCANSSCYVCRTLRKNSSGLSHAHSSGEVPEESAASAANNLGTRMMSGCAVSRSDHCEGLRISTAHRQQGTLTRHSVCLQDGAEPPAQLAHRRATEAAPHVFIGRALVRGQQPDRRQPSVRGSCDRRGV
jgi:hypothetical protein